MAFSGKTSIDFLKRVAQQPLDYGWIEGSDRFKRTRRFIIPTHDTSEIFYRQTELQEQISWHYSL